ncbi:MAG: Bax inhibitor-1/YccA family protein [Myxococcales bacterium]
MALDPWTSSAALDRGATVAGVFMARVYRWMAFGLALTGLFAYGTATSPGMVRAIFGNPILFYGLIFAQLGMVLAFSSVVRRASFGAAAAMFLAYCALTGLTFASIFLVYTHGSIARAFFVTGGTFAAMSVYGTVTKRDLSSFGHFLFMGLIGVVLAGIVNIFLASSALDFVISCMGVVVFTGLTAYDTQKIRSFAEVGDDRLALSGALALYLDFINLFLILLRFFGGGDRRR